MEICTHFSFVTWRFAGEKSEEVKSARTSKITSNWIGRLKLSREKVCFMKNPIYICYLNQEGAGSTLLMGPIDSLVLFEQHK